jgi:predicted enzyme related to lactoylglutathione lyase
MKLVAAILEFIFGCHHGGLSRVFTIEGRSYKVCCDCGKKFDYSLATMSMKRPIQPVPRWRFSLRGLSFPGFSMRGFSMRGFSLRGFSLRKGRSFSLVILATLLGAGIVRVVPSAAVAQAAAVVTPGVAVGPQYDSSHVYVAPQDFDRFVSSFVATFGGITGKQGVFTVTPAPSSTMSQLVVTPVGTLSVFGFRTPAPYPFGAERTGYLVTNMEAAIAAARASGADVLVAPFDDPIGRDAIIQWPGGVNTQLYWHTTPPSFKTLETIPENRVYVSADRVSAFVDSFLRFSQGKVVSDDAQAPGVELGRPSETYRRIRIQSGFGKMTVLVTDGHLPFPYGRETTGYEVANLADTLAKAKAAGVTILAGPYTAEQRDAAVVQFPGGYIAEIHGPAAR